MPFDISSATGPCPASEPATPVAEKESSKTSNLPNPQFCEGALFKGMDFCDIFKGWNGDLQRTPKATLDPKGHPSLLLVGPRRTFHESSEMAILRLRGKKKPWMRLVFKLGSSSIVPGEIPVEDSGDTSSLQIQLRYLPLAT